MITAGIKEAKNNLSRYLAHVKAGNDVVITERGKPIARITKTDSRGTSIRSALGPLLQRGTVSLPSRKLEKETLLTVHAPGKNISEMVVEDRR